MKELKDEDLYFFIDETGDSTFYSRKGKLIVGRNGCSKRLTLGFARLKHDPAIMREQIVALRQKVLQIPEYQKYRSIELQQPAFHAADDPPEVREIFFNLIAELHFCAVFVVSQKDERTFKKFYEANTNRYYDDLVSQLVQNSLHKYKRNHICIAARGSSIRQKPLEDAVNLARRRFQEHTGIDRDTEVFVDVQSPNGEPCLSVIDYVGWSIQRAYETGDMSYFKRVEHKIPLIRELRGRKKTIYYCAKRPFKVD